MEKSIYLWNEVNESKQVFEKFYGLLWNLQCFVIIEIKVVFIYLVAKYSVTIKFYKCFAQLFLSHNFIEIEWHMNT